MSENTDDRDIEPEDATPASESPTPVDPTSDEPSRNFSNAVDSGAQIAKGMLNRSAAREAARAATGSLGAAAAGGTGAAAGQAAGSAAGSAAAGQAAGSVAGAAGGAILSEAGNVARAAEDGDGMAAADAAVRAAASTAASAAFTPVAGAAVNVVLNTKPGRKLTRLTSWLLVVAIMIPIMFVVGAVVTVSMSVSTFLGGSDPDQYMCLTGEMSNGKVVSEKDKQQIAADVSALAYKRGLGKEGAIIGVMTVMAESDFKVEARDGLQSDSTPEALLSVGLFQQMPFYWANEVWPKGTTQTDPAFSDPRYINAARAKIYNTNYAAGKFYDRFKTGKLAGNKWESLKPWTVAQEIQKSAFDSGSNYRKRYADAVRTVNTLVFNFPTIEKGTSPSISEAVKADESIPDVCGLLVANLGDVKDYIIPLNGKSKYTDNTSVVYKNVSVALARAQAFVGHAELACSDGKCQSLCDHLAGKVWGYSNSGYYSAKLHWNAAVAEGIAHPGGTNIPIGALMFWNTGPFGHVATYVGNGMVVSNMTTATRADGTGGSNVYLMSADWWTSRAHYYGWADPKFRGVKLKGAGFD